MSVSLNDKPNRVTVSGDTVTVTAGSGIQGPQGATGPTGAGGTVAFFGNFFSTETQTNASTTAKNTFTLNSTVDSSGVSIVDSTKITFGAGTDGTYDLQFSAQFDKTDSGTDEVDIWISKNGTDLEWSNTTLSLVGNNAKAVPAWNFQLNDVTAGDFFQLHWWSPDSAMRVLATAAGTSPTRPAVPSLIVTVAQVTYTQVGPTGPAGATGATGPGVAAGGNTGQVLAKSSTTDYATTWVTPTPTDATYVTLSTNGTLTNERVLTAGTGILITDAGAGSTVTVGLSATPAPTDATYLTLTTNGTLTSERVLTAGTGISITDGGAGSTATVATSAILPTIVDAKGDLLVGTSDNNVGRLAVGTNSRFLMADSAATSGLKWNRSALYAHSRSTFWQGPPNHNGPSGLAWPTINRAYFMPMALYPGTVITAVAIHVTIAGATGNVVRLALFNDNAGSPGTVVEQTTVAGDSTGYKTWTLATPYTCPELFWLAAAPQGSGSPGQTWLGSGNQGIPTGDSNASFSGTLVSVAYLTISGSFADNPSVLWDTNARFPYLLVRVQ